MTIHLDEDGWLVEELNDADTSCRNDNTPTQHCKRCRKDQPVENFTRLVSEKQALFLARRDNLSDTTDDLYERAAMHKRTVKMVHKLCNACAAKLRRNTKGTADEYDQRLRLTKRYENHVPNPEYISPKETPHKPPTITEREAKVMAYRAALGANRAEGRRKAEKKRHVAAYAGMMREVYNEIQRIAVRMKSARSQENEEVMAFLNAYTEHLKVLRGSIRRDRYDYSIETPLNSAFKYINYDNIITRDAMAALRALPDLELDRIAPRLLPTADLYAERARRDTEYADSFWVK